MDTSMFLARAFALVFLASSIGMFFYKDFFKKLLDGYEKNVATMYVGSMVEMSLGFLIVGLHNVWVPGWPVFITVMGWAMLVESTLIMATPKSVLKLTKNMLKVKNVTFLFQILGIAFGIYMAYHGFLG